MAKWGVICTTNAPTRDVLGFCAHHLDLGAERLYIYLDHEDHVTADRIRPHKQIKVQICDDAWWAKRKGRPEMHQVRQVMNARHAGNRKVEVDWLTHIDVDEFLWPQQPIREILDKMPVHSLCGRVRPIEALTQDPDHPTAPETCFKAFPIKRPERNDTTARVYPTFGTHLNGGFLSHVAGKMFFRAGIGMRAKIHNVYLDDDENPGQVEMPEIELCHMHAESWDEWRARFDYRHQYGAYRAELRNGPGGLSMHELFNAILQDSENGLRQFYNEVCLATPALQERLESEGLLRRHNLNLSEKIARHFPE